MPREFRNSVPRKIIGPKIEEERDPKFSWFPNLNPS
jgi:hypothetical protein